MGGVIRGDSADINGNFVLMDWLKLFKRTTKAIEYFHHTSIPKWYNHKLMVSTERDNGFSTSQIRAIIEAARDNGVAEMLCERKGSEQIPGYLLHFRLEPIRHNPTVEKALVDPYADTRRYAWVKSPLAGECYIASKPGDPPFVSIGKFVEQGAILCVILAMKMSNAIGAEQTGRVVHRHVEDGVVVKPGEPLFIIDTHAKDELVGRL